MEERAISLWGVEAIHGIQVGERGIRDDCDDIIASCSKASPTQKSRQIDADSSESSRSSSPQFSPLTPKKGAFATHAKASPPKATPAKAAAYQGRVDVRDDVLAALSKNDCAIANAIESLAGGMKEMAEAIKESTVAANKIAAEFVECNKNNVTQIVMLMVFS